MRIPEGQSGYARMIGDTRGLANVSEEFWEHGVLEVRDTHELEGLLQGL